MLSIKLTEGDKNDCEYSVCNAFGGGGLRKRLCLKGFRGFTLAEVLITLVVIGVIAAMTIPNIIQNMHEKATVMKLKKVYSTLNSAVKAAVAANGSIDNWNFLYSNDTGVNNKNNGITFLNYIRPYLKIEKECDVSEAGCWSQNKSKKLNNSNWTTVNSVTSYVKYVLSDGTFVVLWFGYPKCDNSRDGFDTGTSDNAINQICGHFYVDVNGYKGENTLGKDLFGFYITKNGQVVPCGTPADVAEPIDNCTLDTSGWGCAAWVIFRENMDYLRGKTIGW